MTLKHVQVALDQTLPQATGERMVLIEACYNADRKGVVRATQAEMAKACRMSRKTVNQWLQILADEGLLVKIRRGRFALPSKWRQEGGGEAEVDDGMVETSPGVYEPKGGAAGPSEDED